LGAVIRLTFNDINNDINNAEKGKAGFSSQKSMLSRRFVPRGLVCPLVAPLSEKILRLFSEYKKR